jgi:histidine ammonia-lyase
VQGSVGASGDLAPLSHLALGLIGEGDCFFRGKLIPTMDALSQLNLKPLQLEAKEGLALINGTHFMAVLGARAVCEAQTIALSANVIAALSLDGFKGSLVAFDERIHAVRKQPGQTKVAAFIRGLFEGHDEIMESHKDCSKVQDPYSFRCVPQVHGATADVIDFVKARVEGDLQSVTDNPLVLDEHHVVSGGNFHGQALAFAMDFLAIAISELGNISERRLEKLTNPNMSGLPAFLVKESGLNSGFMIPQVVAAALVSENKVLCHPASVDSIPTSADKEDHVSMGPISARKALKVCDHVFKILSLELLAACQAIDLLSPLKPAAKLQRVFNAVRTVSPPVHIDRSLHKDIQKVELWLRQNGVSASLNENSLRKN